MSDEVVRLAVDIVRQTDKAILVELYGEEAWIPKSQIEDMTQDMDTGQTVIVIPMWLHEDKFL